MAPQRYERVSADDHDDAAPTSPNNQRQQPIPSSPPPSFRSRTSSVASRNHLLSTDPAATEAERTLHDTFDDGSDSDDDQRDGGDDRQRLMRRTTTQALASTRTGQESERPEFLRTFTRFPGTEVTSTDDSSTRLAGANVTTRSYDRSNDGVFANLNAKPERGEKLEEQPPSYEAAAADAAPPYWENTVLAPGTMSAGDEVYVDGLPVGSVFSFVWNGMISMSFQFVGFLLTYLLHTTHAAKNGSRAGLGITLVQYGFYMRAGARSGAVGPSSPNDPSFAAPADPNAHGGGDGNVQMNDATGMAGGDQPTVAGGGTDWLAYVLMIVGWFMLIKAVSDFIRARKHEQLVLQSPERGLNVPVVADNERPEAVV